jgi:hypothetical protein
MYDYMGVANLGENAQNLRFFLIGLYTWESGRTRYMGRQCDVDGLDESLGTMASFFCWCLTPVTWA